jgi:hypothetical protein
MFSGYAIRDHLPITPQYQEVTACSIPDSTKHTEQILGKVWRHREGIEIGLVLEEKVRRSSISYSGRITPPQHVTGSCIYKGLHPTALFHERTYLEARKPR